MPRDRSPTGLSEARIWFSELMKRVPWRWIVVAVAVLIGLWLISREIGGR
jgi:hypothetical protein